jgi:hypothetical protein
MTNEKEAFVELEQYIFCLGRTIDGDGNLSAADADDKNAADADNKTSTISSKSR